MKSNFSRNHLRSNGNEFKFSELFIFVGNKYKVNQIKHTKVYISTKWIGPISLIKLRVFCSGSKNKTVSAWDLPSFFALNHDLHDVSISFIGLHSSCNICCLKMHVYWTMLSNRFISKQKFNLGLMFKS